jgi:LysR family transcriptional regulator, transcription activator of glutamate synthase operon
MELLQLRYFQTVARLQHISRAAQELNVTQPALSIMVSRLEDELGTRLFDRKGRNIELNRAGCAFLARVNTILCELESAKDEVKELAGNLSKRISIATTNPRLLSGVLKSFLSIHRDVVVSQCCETSDMIEKLLRTGSVDFCLSAPPVDGKGIESAHLCEDEIVLIVPKNHRLANRPSVRLVEVAEDPFITLVQNYNYRGITDALCHSAGFAPNIAFEVDDALMSEMMSLGRGIALLPRYTILPYGKDIKSDYAMLRIEDADSRIKIGLSWLKNRYLPVASLDFRDYVVEKLSQFVTGQFRR